METNDLIKEYLPVSYYLRELLEDNDMSQKELALRCNTSEKHISKLLNNEVLLTYEMALKLENIFNIEATKFLNMEANFRLSILKDSEVISLNSDNIKEYLDDFHYDELVNIGYLKNEKSEIKKIRSLEKLLKINNIELFDQVFYSKYSSLVFEREPYNQNLAYLTYNFAINLINDNINMPKFDKRNQQALIRDLKKKLDGSSLDIIKEYKAILEKHGIYLIVVKDFKYSNLRGFITWRKNNPAIILSSNIELIDDFFFSLMHMIAHLYLHTSRKHWLIDLHERDYEVAEYEASNYANNILIEKRDYIRFQNLKNFSIESIRNFAKYIKVHPSIIAKKLNNDGLLEIKYYNDLKEKI